MIRIKVKLLYSDNKLGKGKPEAYEELEDSATLLDLLTALSSKHELIKNMLKEMKEGTNQELVALINGKYPTNGFSTKLNNGDEIFLIPIIAGG